MEFRLSGDEVTMLFAVTGQPIPPLVESDLQRAHAGRMIAGAAEVQGGLAARGLLSTDSDGSLRLSEALEKLLGLCAYAERAVCIEQSGRIDRVAYLLGHSLVSLRAVDGDYVLRRDDGIRESNGALVALLGGASDVDASGGRAEFVMSVPVLEAVLNSKAQAPREFEQICRANGLDEATVATVIDACNADDTVAVTVFQPDTPRMGSARIARGNGSAYVVACSFPNGRDGEGTACIYRCDWVDLPSKIWGSV
jgi:hypothetical protein